jgi:streptomycin 6-kinase
VDVPIVVRNKALAVGANAWLRDLPKLVVSLAARWDLTIGRTFPDATEAFVAEAMFGDGTAAVLKILVPRDGEAARHEIAVLRRTDGDGCVGLLRSEDAAGALLLERVSTGLLATKVDLQPVARHMLAAADEVARRPV